MGFVITLEGTAQVGDKYRGEVWMVLGYVAVVVVLIQNKLWHCIYYSVVQHH